jgi:hypothetical protein
MPTNKHNFILGSLLGAMVVVVITIIFMNNGLRHEIEKVKSGELYSQSITQDKLSEDLFTTVELELESGEKVEAKLLEGNLDSGYLTGDLTLETHEGDKLVAKVVNTYEIEDGSITEQKLSKVIIEKINKEIDTSIPDRSIDSIKLKEFSVTSTELADGSVTTLKILDGSITGGKLQNAIIETKHLNNYALTEVNIDNNAISSRVIAIGAVTSEKILNQTITNEDISDTASIAWSKLDKTGSSLTDLTTRNFDDLTNRTANYLTITDSGGYYTATNVEGALEELALADGTFVSKTGDTMSGALTIHSYSPAENMLIVEGDGGNGTFVVRMSANGYPTILMSDETGTGKVQIRPAGDNYLPNLALAGTTSLLSSNKFYVKEVNAQGEATVVLQGRAGQEVYKNVLDIWDENNNVAFGVNQDGVVEINALAGTASPLKLNANASQTANLFEINSDGGSGGDLMVVDADGNVGIGTTTPQSAFHVPDGKYAQLEDNTAGAPPAADCDADNERGRISIDTTNNRLYICNGATRGWDYVTLSD